MLASGVMTNDDCDGLMNLAKPGLRPASDKVWAGATYFSV